MNLYIRTNADNKVGIGHLSRSLRLANYFLKRGFRTEIFVDKKNKNLQNFFKNKSKSKFKISYLYEGSSKFKSQKKDSKIFLDKIKKNSILIVDDYRFDYTWQKKMKKFVSKLIVIEDQNLKHHYADYIINSNPTYINKENYVNKNKFSYSKILLGPKYAILNTKIKKKFNTTKKNITFYYGGSGDLEDFSKIIQNLHLKIKKYNFLINVIVGPLSKNIDKIYALKKKIKHYKIYTNINDINEILRKTDLLICSSGMITVESALYNIPSICFQLTENQKIDNKYLESIGLYFNLEGSLIKKTEKITSLIMLIFLNLKYFRKTFLPQFQVDKHGIKRIFNSTILNKYENVKKKKLKDNTEREFQIINDLAVNEYLKARNLVINRENSRNKNKINNLDHYLWWMKEKKNITTLIKDNKKMMFIRNDLTKYQNCNICFNGFVIAHEKLNGLDVIWALKKNLDFLKKKYKKLKIFSVVKKNNNFANLHTKFINFHLYKHNSAAINKLLLSKFGNLNKLNVYVHNNFY